jgi:hypothetical protein
MRGITARRRQDVGLCNQTLESEIVGQERSAVLGLLCRSIFRGGWRLRLIGWLWGAGRLVARVLWVSFFTTGRLGRMTEGSAPLSNAPSRPLALVLSLSM